MEVTFLQVADYANISNEQKLNVMGIFGSLRAHTFPVVHPEMYVVTQLSAGATEYGRNCTLSIKLLNEDASLEIVSFSSPLVVPLGDRGLPVNMNILLRLVNTQFPGPGTYQFSVLIDDDEKRTLPLEVLKLENPSA